MKKPKKYLSVEYLPDHLVKIKWENGKETILSFLELEGIYNIAKMKRKEARS